MPKFVALSVTTKAEPTAPLEVVIGDVVRVSADFDEATLTRLVRALGASTMISMKMAIYCSTSPVDLRRSFDGLAAATKDTLAKDPRSGALFLFVNKAGNRLKAIW